MALDTEYLWATIETKVIAEPGEQYKDGAIRLLDSDQVVAIERDNSLRQDICHCISFFTRGTMWIPPLIVGALHNPPKGKIHDFSSGRAVAPSSWR